MKLKVKKLSPEAILPTKATDCAAGWDLYALHYKDFSHLQASQIIMIQTGIALEIPLGYFGMIAPRSSLAKELTQYNSPGIIDSDYRGEILVGLRLMEYTDYTIKKGDRIAQLLILPVPEIELEEVEELSETVRGTKGFGSTGK